MGQPPRFSPHEPQNRMDAVPPSPGSFGFVMAAAFAIIAGLLALSGHPAAAVVFVGVAVVFCGAAAFCPGRLDCLNLLWFRLGLGLHRVVSPVVLFIVFVAGVVPTALFARVFRLLDFPCRPSPRVATYWSRSARTPVRLDRQY